MVKDRALVVAIMLGATFFAVTAVQGKTGTPVRQSHASRGRVDVTGQVLKVDINARSMTLRSGGSMVNLDISNPVLQGYGSVTAIKKGDRVGAGYTANGIRITKLPRTGGLPEESLPTPSSVQKPKKPSPFARRMNTGGKSFADVDNNKDGKITPIELSVVIPDLTMEQFRQYDKNHDGHLNRAEFEQITLP